jgi:hypothetical protein
LFASLDQRRYQQAKDRIDRIPLAALVDDQAACAALVQALASQSPGPGKGRARD